MDREILDKWRDEYTERYEEERKKVEACLTLAGFTDTQIYELANRYWPKHPSYFTVATPWYLVLWKGCRIVIGWRKNVCHIDWSGTSLRGVVTQDDVTKTEYMVHAWTWEKVLEYLKILRISLQEEMEK